MDLGEVKGREEKRAVAEGGASKAVRMVSGFSFPKMPPAQIAEALTCFGMSLVANLCPEDIAILQPDLVPAVLASFLASFIDPPKDELEGEDAQLGFKVLEALDNLEHHAEAIQVLRLYNKTRGSTGTGEEGAKGHAAPRSA